MSITEHSDIFGVATATEAQATRAILARPHGAYTEHDIGAVIVPAYFACCADGGLNPAIVLAQAVWEAANFSSWWAARPRRNPAGIGVNGATCVATPADRTAWAWRKEYLRWDAGMSFDSWQDDAIPAHVGRLLAWFTLPADRSPAQRKLVERALAYRPLAAKHHGSAANLKELGTLYNRSGAGWASPGPTYGRNLAITAQRIERGR